MKKTTTMLPAMLAVFLLLIAAQNSSGQQYAKIKLKNNSYLKGNIVEGIDSTGVIININGLTSRIPMDNIKDINFKYNTGHNKMLDPMEYSQFKKGYFHSIGMGIITGNEYTDFSATMVNGYRFNPLLNAGLGVSYNRYENMTTLPVFAEYRGYPLKQKFAPYFFSQLGYGFRVETFDNAYYESIETKGGLYWGAGIGYQINFYETALSFSIGYTHQGSKTEYSTPQYWYFDSIGYSENTIEYSEKRTMGRADIKINLIF